MRSPVGLWLLPLLCAGGVHAARAGEQAVVALDGASPPVAFAAKELRKELEARGFTVQETGLTEAATARIVLTSMDSETGRRCAQELGVTDVPRQPEGFALRKGKAAGCWCVVGAGAAGTMYGTLDLAEQVRMSGSLDGVKETISQPRFPFRAVKFNLPWMSYRQHESLQLHADTCRDPAFWQRFLDMMARNRFNALTLWNLHTFHYLIRPKNFPEACPFSDQELAEWQEFWRKLFRMAKDRGIETYLVNWNIFVSPEFAKAHQVAAYSIKGDFFGDGDTSEIVKRYTRECVAQVIDEYPGLAGLGITLGEAMGGMTPQEREDWLTETFIAGMKAAKRPIKFIHRAPLSANKGSGGSTDDKTPAITRMAIDDAGHTSPVWVEMKFNWSHGHSSPVLSIIHGGKAGAGYWEPKPANYRITWMVRNEDFFLLRWGEPGFVRKHIELNGEDYVGGYFVGSECYIPARNYLDKPDLPGRCAFAFERQWLFYLLWGRLLYDPRTPDAVFEAAFDARYGKETGRDLLAAYAAASRMPLRLASFYRSTWDFTLYSEGFLAPAKSKGKAEDAFISVDDLIKTAMLDPGYVSVGDYVKAAGKPFEAGKVTPPALADALAKDGEEALRRAAALAGRTGAVEQELTDVKAWAHLSLYLAEKLRAAVALETYRRTKDAAEQARAVALLKNAAKEWDQVIAAVKPFHPQAPLIHLGKADFSWERYREQVRRDIELARKP